MWHPEDDARFCLACGAPLASLPRFGRERKACGACDFVLFTNTASAAAAVVARGRDILLVRRGIAPGKGKWGFPAGFQEYGETLEAAAVREVCEETGLSIELRRLLRVVHATENPRKFVNLAVYLGVAVAGELQAADDATDARYFPLDALPSDLAFANNREILSELLGEYPHGDID